MFNLSVRLKIVVATLICTVLIFLQITPAIRWIDSLLNNPDEVTNLKVRQLEDKLVLSWDEPSEIDIRSFIIEGVEGESVKLKRNIDTYEISNLGSVSELNFKVEDITGRKSRGIKIEVLSPEVIQRELFNEKTYNIVDLSEEERRSTAEIFKTVALNFIVCLALTFFILWGSVDNLKSLVLSFYPAVTTSSFIIISLTLLYSETNQANKLLLSFLITAVYLVVLYFVELTINILNTSVKIQIPLAQAGRAAQFIFSLISSYLILIIFFGSSYSFFEKIVFIVPIILYLTFSSLLMLPNELIATAFYKSLSVTAALGFGIFVLSIWPIEYIYAILCIAVCYYILLSISLEVRSTINRYVWVEYTVLILLICVILFTNSSWGINGNLL